MTIRNKVLSIKRDTDNAQLNAFNAYVSTINDSNDFAIKHWLVIAECDLRSALEKIEKLRKEHNG